MSEPAVQVVGLSKRFALGGRDFGYRTLRDRLAGWFGRRPTPVETQAGTRDESKAQSQREIWALRDVSFEVPRGEALGIIGANGAGKSTLLKLLSRITEPTSGRIRLRGRVASLLEVGTGFHPELTGRENIRLNGILMGMSRAEIREHFDEIVAFAGVERFLDTPVKRYSSGMYVRLAFAVAAHLTPEILIVDEVLAVGDHEFQRRCLGRMRDVARTGRTVLFVSHNMSAIEELCPRAVLLRDGTLVRSGPTAEVVADYLSAKTGRAEWEFDDGTPREGSGNARIVKLEVLAALADSPLETLPFLEPFRLRIRYRADKRLERPQFGLALLTENDQRVFLTTTRETGCEIPFIDGAGCVDCLVDSPNLLPGTYYLEAWIVEVAGVLFADHLRMVGRVEIVVGNWRGSALSDLTYSDRGRVYLPCRWVEARTNAVDASGGMSPC